MNVLTCLAIISSLLVVTSTSTVLSIVWLVVVFLIAAFILSFYSLSYVALTYVIVYVGAIAILFLFVVQLLDQRSHLLEGPTVKTFSFLKYNTKNQSTTFSSSLFFSILILLLLFTEINQSIPLLKDWSFFNDVESIQNKGYYSFITLQEIIELRPPFSSPNLNEETIKYNTLSDLNNISNSLNGFLAPMGTETNIKYTSQIQNFGEWLYGGASLALIVVSIILLLAMVGPIVVCWSLV